MLLLIALLQASFEPDPVQDTETVLARATERGGGIVRCPAQGVEHGARGYAVLPESSDFPARVPFFIDQGHLVVGVPLGDGELRLVTGAQELGSVRYEGVELGEEGRCMTLDVVPDLASWISRPELFDCQRGGVCEQMARLGEIPPEKQAYVDDVRAYCGCQTSP